MRCTDCGADLSGLTHDHLGRVVCSQCGRRNSDESQNEGLSTLELSSTNHLALDRFTLSNCIGEGSFGTVFKAYDKELQRNVAIKTPKRLGDALNVDLFLREARAASQLRHPHIVAVFDVIQEQDSISIISDFIEGISLREWLTIRKPIIEKSLEVLTLVCRAVEYAHQKGIVHRDIKPSNIVMDEKDQPHLLDFGLSYSRSVPLGSIGVAGMPIGTPAFMAPEQVRGDRTQVDRWTDVYALGIILYQMLTKHLPFHGSSEVMFQDILHSAPPSPRNFDKAIPLSLEAICLKAIAKEPAQRYASAEAMAQDIDNYMQGKPVAAYGKLEARVVGNILRRRFATGMASAMGAGLLGTGTWIFISQRKKDPRRRVMIEIDSPDAAMTIERMTEESGLPEPVLIEGLGPGREMRLEPGWYRFTFSKGKDRMVIYRTVPKLNTKPILKSSGIVLNHRIWTMKSSLVVLPPVRMNSPIVQRTETSFVEGGTFVAENAIGLMKGTRVEVDSFLMDRFEVTNAQWSRLFPNSTIRSAGDPQSPVVNVEFEHALAYAEKVGMRLPTAWEHLWAATNRNTTRFPWGNEVQEQDWPIGQDAMDSFDLNGSTPAIQKLCTGVLEWADTPPPQFPPNLPNIPDNDPYAFQRNLIRAIVGGPLEFQQPGQRLTSKSTPMKFGFESTDRFFPNVGFRCVRTVN